MFFAVASSALVYLNGVFSPINVLITRIGGIHDLII